MLDVIAVIVLVALVAPPVVLIGIQVRRFFVRWFRGYNVRDHNESPRSSRWASRTRLMNRVCPGCGNVISSSAMTCEHCRLRFDPAPIHHPAERWDRS